MAYDNARLPQALMLTGMATQTPAYVDAGLRTLRWLMTQQTTSTGHFRPVGTAGFGELRQPPRAFDQQPVEATATIAACLTAWRADGDAEWKAIATSVFSWFLGSNDLSVPLVDPQTGSCRDGLHPDRANENRGGESVVSYLLGAGRDASACARQYRSDKPRGASRHRRLSSASTHANANEDTLLQATFLNRRALHLRPDPARVIVRPFKPATEPRDLNPTDKTPCQPYRRARSRISIRRPRPASWPMCWRISRAGIATCWRRSSAGPTKWRRLCWRMARFPKSSAS